MLAEMLFKQDVKIDLLIGMFLNMPQPNFALLTEASLKKNQNFTSN